ncbi:MAG: hypothetical protein RLZZ612_1125 [Pseudomonadota bacterium]|jgi:predicted metal-dependent hydrolase
MILRDVSVPSPWQHPRANQRVQLGSHSIAYVLQRSARRSVGLWVDAEGLRIRAPQRMSLAEINAALQSKSAWILRKLHDFQVSNTASGAPVLLWQDGMALAWLGADLTVRCCTQSLSQCWRDGNTLWVGLLHHDDQAAQMRHAVQAWAKRQALDHLTKRLDYFAKRLCVSWTHLSLSSARTRWGSAKSDGSIRLHWRLMQFAPAVLDYVVIHELAHLRHMNHGPDFWRLVGALEPNWPALRQVLRRQRLPVW